MTRHQSIQLARWWTAIADVHARIDNELIPVGHISGSKILI